MEGVLIVGEQDEAWKQPRWDERDEEMVRDGREELVEMVEMVSR